jgi:hypothetical protein
VCRLSVENKCLSAQPKSREERAVGSRSKLAGKMKFLAS